MALAFVVFHSTYLFLSVCIRVNLWLKLFDGLALVGPSRPSWLMIGFMPCPIAASPHLFRFPWLASVDSPLNFSVKIRAFRGQKELWSTCSRSSFLPFHSIHLH